MELLPNFLRVMDTCIAFFLMLMAVGALRSAVETGQPLLVRLLCLVAFVTLIVSGFYLVWLAACS